MALWYLKHYRGIAPKRRPLIRKHMAKRFCFHICFWSGEFQDFVGVTPHGQALQGTTEDMLLSLESKPVPTLPQ